MKDIGCFILQLSIRVFDLWECFLTDIITLLILEERHYPCQNRFSFILYINILVWVLLYLLNISLITFCLNTRKLYKGDLITPWKREFGKTYKEDVEYVVGFVPIPVPFVKKCINGCGKQTLREDGECVHCYEYRELYKKEPPIKRKIWRMILMMNKRNDNEFGRLPRHLVVHFIKNYL